jgi:putative ABC transport system permease protein
VLHVRGVGDGPASFDGIQTAVASVDPEIPISPSELASGIVASMSETRTVAFLVAAFAALALVLAAVGLYGLVSYGAAQRVREMGIRMALGARPESLVRLILARGLGIAFLGIGLGLAVSVGLGQALAGLLFGVRPTDPLTLGVASTALLATAALAAWIPARRASRVDAAVSLRDG